MSGYFPPSWEQQDALRALIIDAVLASASWQDKGDLVVEILIPIAGFFVAQIAQRIIVPVLVQILGEQRFASPSAFDGCTLGTNGGLVAFVGMIFLRGATRAAAKRHVPFHVSPLWILLVVAVGITVYGLLFLWLRGFGGRKREWSIVDGQILKEGSEELHPTFIRERQDYFQTDAYNGYSHYFLELHNDRELLATNAYTSKEEFKRDVERVRELTDAIGLDLVWCWRVAAKKWRVAYFPDEWTLVLCGPLDRLTAEDRQWWQQWTYPDFAEHMGSEVDAREALGQLERLEAAYEQELKEAAPYAEFMEKLRRLLNSEGPVVALSHAQFDQQAEEVRGDSTTFLHDGDFAELKP